MLRTSTPVAAVLAFLLAGCAASSPEGSASAECTPQIRFEGVVYSAHDYTDQGASKFGMADEADCHDVGPEAPGSVFSDDPHQVAVWTFRGYSSEQVLGVRFDETSFTVFVADSIPDAERERIFRGLDCTGRHVDLDIPGPGRPTPEEAVAPYAKGTPVSVTQTSRKAEVHDLSDEGAIIRIFRVSRHDDGWWPDGYIECAT